MGVLCLWIPLAVEQGDGQIELNMKRIFACICLLLLSGCGPDSTAEPIAVIPQGCAAPGTIISADLPQPSRGYSYSYRVYLPPCYAAESGTLYPVLYLVPGRSSAPDAWFSAGLAEVVDNLIWSKETPPFIIVVTENTESDPLADIIYGELIPFVESQYPILEDRRYRAVAGGSLGGVAAYRLAFQHPDTFSSAGIFGAGAISGEEPRIHEWLASLTDENRIRIFMDTGAEDVLMLERAKAMKSLLDAAGVENLLHTGQGGHNYGYWVSNFDMFLRWLVKDW